MFAIIVHFWPHAAKVFGSSFDREFFVVCIKNSVLDSQYFYSYCSLILTHRATAGMGVTISAYHPMKWIGWTIALSMLIVFSTAFSIFEYRQNLELTSHLIVQAAVSFTAFLAMVITLYVTGTHAYQMSIEHQLYVEAINSQFVQSQLFIFNET